MSDGIQKREIILSTVVNIQIGKRIKLMRLIYLPNAKDNRTLIGIDFIEQCGIGLDCAQKIWYYKDEPQKVFDFDLPVTIKANENINSVSINEPKSERLDIISKFFENFEISNSSCYEPNEIDKIFENSIPDNFEMNVEEDLFPPPIKCKVMLILTNYR